VSALLTSLILTVAGLAIGQFQMLEKRKAASTAAHMARSMTKAADSVNRRGAVTQP
jgi:hypothetical protein